jgi:hypothetical protein
LIGTDGDPTRYRDRFCQAPDRRSGRDADAQQAERLKRTRCAAPGCAGDILCTHDPERVQCEVSEGRHHLRSVACPDLRPILIEGDIAHPVDAVFDCPMPTNQLEESSTIGVLPLEARDAEMDLMAKLGRSVSGLDRHIGFNSEDLSGVRKVDVLTRVDPRRRPDEPILGPSMAGVRRPVGWEKKSSNPGRRSWREVLADCPSP